MGKSLPENVICIPKAAKDSLNYSITIIIRKRPSHMIIHVDYC